MQNMLLILEAMACFLSKCLYDQPVACPVIYYWKELLRVAITYFIFKYTILRSKQCWIKRCITWYDSLQFYIYLAAFSQHVSRYCWVTQKFVNYGTMPVVKNSKFRVAITYSISYPNTPFYEENNAESRYNILNLTLNLRGVVTTPLGSQCHNK